MSNPSYAPEQYAPNVTDSGALKLADSAVAPLVAAARGYSWLQEPAVKGFAKDHHMGAGNTKVVRQLAQVVNDTGAMVMPWFRVDRVLEAQSHGIEASFDALQYRPTRPRAFGDGHIAKYEMRLGDPSIIDVHPATPKSWFEPGGVANILITEGLLKADAAVTGMLTAAGVDKAVLAGSDQPSAARSKLTEVMDAIPVRDRTLILALVGVGNWHRNALEFSAIPTKDANVILGFDADAATNINVWTQLDRLTTFLTDRGARVQYLSLEEANLADVAAGGKGKLGIDDALARYTDWSTLISYQNLNSILPERPKDSVVAREGAWRIAGATDEHPAGTSTQVCHEVRNEFGSGSGDLRWETKFPFGGRLAQVVSTRSPTQTEIESGVYEKGWTPKDSPELKMTAVVEIGWVDQFTGEPRSTRIEGPASVVAYQEPKDWGRASANVDLPVDVFDIPQFPPGKDGRDWLNAVKSHRADERQTLTAWDTLGWVPVPDSDTCAFIAGSGQVIAPDRQTREAVVSAVTETDLPAASRFGVRLPAGEPLTEDWKSEVRDAIRRMFSSYVFSGVWADPGTAAVVLAAGLRPYLPLRTHSVVYLQGPPGKGKSWTAAAIASFHQSSPGLFDNNSLPAGANATAYATEIAVSKANLWIVDDIAPTLDRRKAEEQASKIADMIRAIHNAASRQRGNGSGGLAKTRTPRALLVLTAENNAQLRSVRDRTLEVTFGEGSLSNGSDGNLVERVSTFRDEDDAPALIAGALVQFIQAITAGPGEWAKMVRDERELRTDLESDYRVLMQERGVNNSNVARKAKIGADLALGLQAMLSLCDAVGGLEREYEAVSAYTKGGLFEQLGNLVADNALGQQRRSPGQTLVEAIRGMLISGDAYLDSAAGDGTPPLGGAADAGNAQLGWQKTPEGEWRPRGRYMIGVVTEAPDGEGERLAVIMQKPTSGLALKFDPTIGHGSDGSTMFRTLYAEHLVHPHYQSTLERTGRVSVQIRRTSNVRIWGVPLSLDEILEGDQA